MKAAGNAKGGGGRCWFLQSLYSVIVVLCCYHRASGFTFPTAARVTTTSFRTVSTTRRALFPPDLTDFASIITEKPLPSLDTLSVNYFLDSAANGNYGPSAILASSLLLLSLVIQTLFPPGELVTKTMLESIVEGTYLGRNEIDNLKCVYKASRDGWNALNFHDAVDEKGSALVVARTLSGTTFGGFNPVGWRSTDDYYTSTAAFLWCSAGGGRIYKFPVLAGGNAAVFDYATAGPCFGSSDLIIGPPKAAIMGGFAGPDTEDISSSAGSLRQGRGSVGLTYELSSSCNAQKDWPVCGPFRLADLEIYCNERR